MLSQPAEPPRGSAGAEPGASPRAAGGMAHAGGIAPRRVGTQATMPTESRVDEIGQKEGATMADEPVVHVLWINAGLSCDGDSVALTAAMQPSIEDIVLGTLPGLPKVDVHWPLIAFENGPIGGDRDFIEWFFKGERGEIDPFVLVIEGSIPNEAIKKEGYWCGFGINPATGQPITTS
jgi:hydrogenase small subunit